MALRALDVAWGVDAFAALGVVVFAAWRTGAGALGGFALVLLASAIVPGAARVPEALWRPLLALEAVGWVTLVVAASASEGRRLSRRLLGAWLASTGALVLGLSLGGAGRATVGSGLIAAALAYKLGVVPAFSWAPLLLRHPVRRVSAAGVLAFAAGLVSVALVRTAVPDPHAFRLVLRAAALVTIPYAAWHVRRQWRSDRRCARSYGAVVLAGLVLLGLGVSF